ncbi:hypothetical protein [Vagococcus xieshaowenii]|uniref:hypothetical protein n=1 Tax=Vagococcus xieshaowenii TaxID=2562451 RepID=UPI00143230D9|nr:hypothetical protein [Vagococcus xieshaowenii]
MMKTQIKIIRSIEVRELENEVNKWIQNFSVNVRSIDIKVPDENNAMYMAVILYS